MPDDPKKRGPADRERVNVHEKYEVEYWTDKWAVTEKQLRDCVAKVGVIAKDVARCLGK